MLRRLSTFAVVVFLVVFAIPGTGARAAKRFPISISMPGSSDGPSVSCEIEEENKRPCPGSVGVVTTPGERGHLRVGGGVLVADDLFLTDSHVFFPEHRGKLDEKVRRPKIRIRFPKAVSPGGEALPGLDVDANLVFASELKAQDVVGSDGKQIIKDRLEPDWALLKLRKPIDPKRRHARISSAPVADGQAVEFWKTQVSEEGARVVVTHESCLIQDHGIPSDQKRGFLAGSGCHFEEGNSGSPLFDEKGDLLAILKGHVDLPEGAGQENLSLNAPEGPVAPEKESRPPVRISVWTMLGAPIPKIPKPPVPTSIPGTRVHIPRLPDIVVGGSENNRSNEVASAPAGSRHGLFTAMACLSRWTLESWPANADACYFAVSTVYKSNKAESSEIENPGVEIFMPSEGNEAPYAIKPSKAWLPAGLDPRFEWLSVQLGTPGSNLNLGYPRCFKDDAKFPGGVEKSSYPGLPSVTIWIDSKDDPDAFVAVIIQTPQAQVPVDVNRCADLQEPREGGAASLSPTAAEADRAPAADVLANCGERPRLRDYFDKALPGKVPSYRTFEDVFSDNMLSAAPLVSDLFSGNQRPPTWKIIGIYYPEGRIKLGEVVDGTVKTRQQTAKEKVNEQENWCATTGKEAFPYRLGFGVGNESKPMAHVEVVDDSKRVRMDESVPVKVDRTALSFSQPVLAISDGTGFLAGIDLTEEGAKVTGEGRANFRCRQLKGTELGLMLCKVSQKHMMALLPLPMGSYYVILDDGLVSGTSIKLGDFGEPGQDHQ